MRFCVSDFRGRRTGPDHRPGSEVASVIATAQAHATTEDRDAADPQGRGSKNRGDQEQHFASANAENEATQGHPQRKRSVVLDRLDFWTLFLEDRQHLDLLLWREL